MAETQNIRNQSQLPPPTPSLVSNPIAGNITHDPSVIEGQHPITPTIQQGELPDVAYTHTGTGLAPIMSTHSKDANEEDIVGTTLWNARNRFFEPLTRPSRQILKKHFPWATSWGWNHFRQEWEPLHHGKPKK